MRKIRVVHLTIGLQWGGAETLMAAIASHLDPTRFDVSVIALQENGPVGEQLKRAGIPVQALGIKKGWDPRVLFQLRRSLAALKPDIVHSHLLQANVLACLTRGDHAVIWHEHGTGEWLNPVMRFIERSVIPRCDAVIAISKNVRDNLAARVPGVEHRITVLPNAIDARAIHEATAADKTRIRKETWALGTDHFIVGFVGRLDDKFKGISVLLKSIAQLKPAFPPLRLMIVGGGNDRAALEQLTRQLKIEDSVLFTGPRSDLDQIYPAFDILALPSLSEGFGIVLLEAMAHGIPVVASRVGGIPEVVIDQETGLLVPPGDPGALAQQLENLLHDPEKRKRMGQKGSERVRAHYLLDHVMKKLEDIYTSILNPQRR